MGGSGWDGGLDGGGFGDRASRLGPSGMWVGGAGKADKTAPSNMGATTRIDILTITQNSSLTNWITTLLLSM